MTKQKISASEQFDEAVLATLPYFNRLQALAYKSGKKRKQLSHKIGDGETLHMRRSDKDFAQFARKINRHLVRLSAKLHGEELNREDFIKPRPHIENKMREIKAAVVRSLF